MGYKLLNVDHAYTELITIPSQHRGHFHHAMPCHAMPRHAMPCVVHHRCGVRATTCLFTRGLKDQLYITQISSPHERDTECESKNEDGDSCTVRYFIDSYTSHHSFALSTSLSDSDGGDACSRAHTLRRFH